MRVAIIGIGNEFNGDDAAGVLAARCLQKRLRRQGFAQFQEPGDVLVIEAGTAPESFTGPLRRFRPDWVILLDAAEMNAPPGTVSLLEWGSALGWTGSTHGLPPTVFAEYLIKEIGCRVTLVGIQPAQLDFDGGVSRPVRAGIRIAVRMVQKWIEQPIQ